MIRPGKVPYPPVHLIVGVARTLGAELPYRPAVVMFGVEEADERRERVAVCAAGIGGRGTRCGDYCWRVKVESVVRSWRGENEGSERNSTVLLSVT